MQALGQSSIDSAMETGGVGDRGQAGDLEEGRQTHKRKLDGLVAEGWHIAWFRVARDWGMVFRDAPLLQSLLVHRGVPTR